MNDQRCENCRFFDFVYGYGGWVCRKRAPVCVPIDGTVSMLRLEQTGTFYTTVRSYDWCGEWQGKS